MTSPVTLTSEEKIIVALACLIGIIFLLFAPHSCKPGATAFSLSPRESSPLTKNSTQSNKATSNNTSRVDARSKDALAVNPTQRPLEDSSSLRREPSPQSLQTSSYSPPSTSQNKDQETAALTSTDNVPTKPESPSAASLASSALASEQADRLAQTEKKNKEFLRQIEALATESNALKEERREREARFAETKNEYAATLKFARDQHQEELLALGKRNKQLSQELAGAPKGIAPDEAPSNGEQKEETVEPNNESPEKSEHPAEPGFAQNDEDLDDSKKALVTAIREMDSLSGDALAARYQALEKQLSSKSSGRIRFESGQSQASTSEITRIEAIAETSQPNSEYLVAGFADRTGSASGNRNLSSERAKFVAEQLGKKVGNGRVQAIYLGQTARFGPPAENRVVEIWEITPATSQ